MGCANNIWAKRGAAIVLAHERHGVDLDRRRRERSEGRCERGLPARLLVSGQAPGERHVEAPLLEHVRVAPARDLCGPAGADRPVLDAWLDHIYADFTGHTVNLPRVVRQTKTHILAEHFPSDLDRLAALAVALARVSWHTWDLSPAHLRAALGLLTVVAWAAGVAFGAPSPRPDP